MLKPLHISDFTVRAHQLWADQWLLLTAGDHAAGHYNTMTVGWGAFGTMWSKPLAMVVVRPSRHTYEFMNRYDTFTLCAFPDSCRPALQLLGSKSGRDGNKIAAAKLTPVAAASVAAPAFKEAELVIECRKSYWTDLQPDHILDDSAAILYPQKDYHRMYFGEILAVSGTEKFG